MSKQISITNILITINIFIYILSVLLSKNIIDIDLDTLVDMGALYSPLVIVKEEWYRVFSAIFLHGGLMHITMNMVSLYIVGRGVELYFSKPSYIALYLFSGLMGSMASLFVHPLSVGVGASGAIFGIFGAIFGFFVVHRKHLATQSQMVFKEFGTILLLNLVLGLSISSIDMSAHIAGVVVGFLGGYMISKNPKSIYLFSILMVISLFVLANLLQQHYVQVYS